MENKNVLLSVKDLHVKFRVRGRILTAIRGISLDIYENESIAIVGESGSGKSVFTKTFAGMLDENGYISDGQIIFNDEELADTTVIYGTNERRAVARIEARLNEYSRLELGAATYREMLELKAAEERRAGLDSADKKRINDEIADLKFKATELFNYKQTLDQSKEKDEIKQAAEQIAAYKARVTELEKEKDRLARESRKAYMADTESRAEFEKNYARLEARYKEEISGEIDDRVRARNAVIAKEIRLSVGRYDLKRRIKLSGKLVKAIKKAMELGVDLFDEEQRNLVFDDVAFRVCYLDETENMLHGTCVLNLANIKYAGDWSKIRGSRIATVFQDPMTSLNPIITIGKQITSIILKHQRCSEVEARIRALELMQKVGIPDAENRFDDYPFQYSGGMRQRIVIAIALSCRPKILICDEPTTALDVTIQAQILELLKQLQKEFGYTIVFITHDLGVVANIADRVAVLYAGQIVEVGTVEDVFYDPRHPYTWALLSSLPQLAVRNTKLYSISGTPPSLYNKIVGDPFAPRNPHCLKIDTLREPPMFKVSDTHYAKTWLLDPRSPKVEKPEIICDIHEKLMRAFNI